MNRTKIEWCNYTVNPIKGICKMYCEYCYAAAMYRRFKWNPETRFDKSAFDGIENIKAGSKVFVCSTHDMFGSWIPSNWIEDIIKVAKESPELVFVYLTKNPQNAWQYTYPKNVWLGVTVENQEQVWRIKTLLQPEIKASLKFVSFEPLQGQVDVDFVNCKTGEKISWFIIGTETGNRKGKTVTLHDWVSRLLYNHADTPVFLKNNLSYCLQGMELIQEYPEVKA